MKPEELIQKYWPYLREVYISPLTRGDDVIWAWQVEINWSGYSTTASFAGESIDYAYDLTVAWIECELKNNREKYR